MILTVFTHLVVFLLGALAGALLLRNNPLKGAQSLDQLETAYEEAKAKLQKK